MDSSLIIEAPIAWMVLAACALDFLFGDPGWLPHPVRLMARVAKGLERRITDRLRDPRMAGLAVTVALVLGTYLAALAVLRAIALFSPLLAVCTQVVLIYTTISMRDLWKEGRGVEESLRAAWRGERGAAPRTQVARIVGRETEGLDDEGVSRAAVESVAESTVDGIISPLFFALLGGAPLALAFKAASTLDSTYGYRLPEVEEFGWAPARLDDAANFVPARLAMVFMPLAALCWRRRAWLSLRTAWSDRRNHASPNAGIPEAAVAGALGVQLGGPSTYHGLTVEKPFLGRALREVRAEDITVACRISLTAGVLFVLFGTGVRLALAA